MRPLLSHLAIFTTSLLAVLGLPVYAWAQIGPMPGPMHDWGVGWWAFGGLIWLVALVLVIIGLVTVLRWLFGGKGHHARSPSSALAILEERYARGEINREEYEQRRRDLGG